MPKNILVSSESNKMRIAYFVGNSMENKSSGVREKVLLQTNEWLLSGCTGRIFSLPDNSIYTLDGRLVYKFPFKPCFHKSGSFWTYIKANIFFMQLNRLQKKMLGQFDIVYSRYFF